MVEKKVVSMEVDEETARVLTVITLFEVSNFMTMMAQTGRTFEMNMWGKIARLYGEKFDEFMGKYTEVRKNLESQVKELIEMIHNEDSGISAELLIPAALYDITMDVLLEAADIISNSTMNAVKELGIGIEEDEANGMQ